MPNFNGIKYSVTSPKRRDTAYFILGIQDSQRKYSRKFDDLLDAAAKESERYLKRSLPKSRGIQHISPSAAVQTPRMRIRDSVEITKKDKPGGSGGGVFKTRKVSVGKGVPYFKDVMYGTGIYSTKGPKRRIQYPHGASYAPYGDKMDKYYYDKMGNPNKLFSNKMPGSYSKAKSLRSYEVIIYSSRGQKPRFEIIQRSRDRTEAFIQAGLRSIDL
jgi:hypothetical protein